MIVRKSYIITKNLYFLVFFPLNLSRINFESLGMTGSPAQKTLPNSTAPTK